MNPPNDADCTGCKGPTVKKRSKLTRKPTRQFDDNKDNAFGIEATRNVILGNAETTIVEKRTQESPSRMKTTPARATCPWALRSARTEKKSDHTVMANKFYLELSKKEIEEDLITMVGHLPSRKPKKRPNAVQDPMDTVFPGSMLSEVKASMYRVPEPEPLMDCDKKGKKKVNY